MTDLLGNEPPATTRRTRASRKVDASTDLAGGGAGAERTQVPAPAGTALAGNMLALIERCVTDKSVDIDKLERMLAFQEKLLTKQAEIDFNEAKQRILASLSEIKIVKRKSVRYDINKSRPALGQAEAFKYAPLEDIDEVLAPLLAREGMDVSYTTTPRQGDGGGVLITMTLKKAGHSEKYELPLPLDTSGGKSNIQGYGSTISYGRRYLVCMAFNIVVVGDDDDGNGGFIEEAQLENLRKLISVIEKADAKRDEAALCKYLKIETLDALPNFKLRQAIGVLEEAAQRLNVSLEG